MLLAFNSKRNAAEKEYTKLFVAEYTALYGILKTEARLPKFKI
jgi:hypothetical protein